MSSPCQNEIVAGAMPVAQITRAFDQGHAALLVTGRSIHDLVVDDGKLRPVIEALRRACRERHGMQLVTYTLATGVDWDASRISDERDRRTIEQALRAHQLGETARAPQADHDEVARVMRGIASLSRSPNGSLSWADGKPLRFGFVLDFAEHLVPGNLTNGTQTDNQLIAIELAHLTGQSLALRGSGNLLMFVSSRDGLIDELVGRALHHVHLDQPDSDEKLQFLNVAAKLYEAAAFDKDLTPAVVANLLNHTPNRSLEAMLRSSHRTKAVLSAKELTVQKGRDVEALSEGSLTVLDTARVDRVQLLGTNAEVPRRILVDQLASSLKRGDSATPANVLLAGPPGTGKTDLAVLTAREAGVACYELHSPKRPFVGQTEQLARHQQQLLKQWTPNLAFTDEITEMLPMERSDFDGDSGASRAVLGALLAALSDESRRGKSLLVAATNVPWRIGAAMRSRFTVIPVLFPLERDFAEIVAATVQRVEPGSEIDARDPLVQEAGALFYAKGASPRHIRAALSNARLLRGHLSAETVLFAARDFTCAIDSVSSRYADLWAIRSCSSRSFLPWSADPSSYPFPDYIKGAVDATSGDVIESELNRRIEELRPHANV